MRSTCKHRQTNENTNKRRQRQRESGKRESDALSPCSPLQSQQVWQSAVHSGCHVDAMRACCLSLTLTSCALSVWMPRLVYCCKQLICAARKPTAAAGVAVDVAACAACAALSANSWSAFRFQLVFHCGAARTCLGFARLCSARRSDLEFRFSLFLCSVSQ